MTDALTLSAPDHPLLHQTGGGKDGDSRLRMFVAWLQNLDKTQSRHRGLGFDM